MKIACGLVVAMFLSSFGRAAENNSLSAASRWSGDNLILISLGNVGANRMSLYGYPRKTTPKLDAWAKEALVFDEAFTPASWTLPVGVSLFTSLYPYTHGVWMRMTHNSLDPRTPTLPEILRDNGYATAAFTGGLDYDPRFSHMRGFQTAARNPHFTHFSITLPQARRWLVDNKDKKFFLFLHGYDTHCPFAADPPYSGTFSAAAPHAADIDFTHCIRGFSNSKDYTAYYAGGCVGMDDKGNCTDQQRKTPVTLKQDDVEYLSRRYDDTLLEEDALVGDFLDSLDPRLLAKTIIVVVADHGEMFAKHGRFGRAGTRRGTHYDDVLHVPFIIRLPGVAGKRIHGLVQSIDVMPTVLKMLGLPVPSDVQGRDLAPLIRDGSAVNHYVYSGMGYNLWSDGRTYDQRALPISVTESIRDEHWKLLHERFYFPAQAGKQAAFDPDTDAAKLATDPSGLKFSETFELYDVAADPEELKNLAAQRPAVVADLWSRLQAWSAAAFRAGKAAPAATKPVPESIIRKARERGYWQ
ncbi:MAG: sulfatase-like hydrolase/transferase [Elusimicrobia bacterium]|nr:sulfatase-like hydrolase/transferase [Elusimicrobiota bacterium]